MPALNDPVITANFPDLGRFVPDCSSITDTQLRQAITAKWPHNKIFYSFSTTPFWKSLYRWYEKPFSPVEMDESKKAIFRSSMRFILDKFHTATNGTLNFVEKDYDSPALGNHLFTDFFTPGIFYYIGGTSQQFQDYDPNTGALTYSRYDNNGNLFQAHVYLPSDNWNTVVTDTWTVNTWAHETAHALGYEHLHEYYDMKELLLRITAGVFCSVLPYPGEIGGPYFGWNPSYAIYPAELDKRLLRLSYEQGLISDNASNDLFMSYIFNGVNLSLFSIFTGLMNQSIYHFLINLESSKDHKLLNKNVAQIIANSSVLLMLILWEMPPLIPVLFALSSAPKYLPEKFNKKLPAKIQTLLGMNYNLYLLNSVFAIMQGHKPLPLLGALSGANFGTYVGTQFSYLMQYPAYGINQVVRKLRNLLSSASVDEQLPANDNDYQAINIAEERSESLAYASGYHHLFSPRTLANRISAWFKPGTEEASNELTVTLGV